MQKSNKKILISVNDFLVGGAQKLIVDQLSYFKNAGYDVSLVTLMDFQNRSNLYNSVPAGVKIYKINIKSSYDILGWFRFFKVLKLNKPDVIFSHLFLSNMMVRVLSFFMPLKIFTVEQNTYENKKNRHILIDRFLAKRSKKIIAVSDEVRDFTIKQQKISSDKCIVINNGVNIKSIDEFKLRIPKKEARSNKGIQPEVKLFLSVARLTHQKNLSLLIESFVLFNTVNKNAVLLLLGEGAEYEKLNNLITKYKAESYIKLMGNIEDIFFYYRSADFLVSTSYIEGLSVAFLEAMAFGLPVAVTKTGGTKILVNDGVNGFIIPNFDSLSVSDTMQKLMVADYTSFSKNAYSKSEDFSIEEMTKKYEELI